MSDQADNPMALLARAARQTMFIMLRRTVAPERQRGLLGAHLRWMIDAEKAGRIVLSGPVAPHAGPTALDGLTILRAPSLADAETFAQGDPFVAEGVVTFEMREWTVNEGAFTVTLTISDSTVAFR